MRAVPIVVVMMVFLLSCSSVFAGKDDRGPAPTIAVSLDPATQEATVTQSKCDNVTFRGTAEIEQSSVTTSDLNLQAVTNTGWSTTVTPSTFTLTGTATVTFEVEVEVPSGTSSLQTGNVIVKASLKAPLFTAIEGETSSIVLVGQYYKVRIDLEDNLIEMDHGEEGTAEGLVYNDGNGNARFRLSLLNVPDGILATLSISEFDVSQEDSQPFKVKLNVLEGADNGIHEVIIRAECMDNDGGVAKIKEYPLFVRVMGLEDKLPGMGPGIVMIVLLITCMAVLLNPRSGWRRRHL
jgi:uncharacterized protein YaiE (UPF0345 family)